MRIATWRNTYSSPSSMKEHQPTRTPRLSFIFLLATIASLGFVALILRVHALELSETMFDGERALEHLAAHVEPGPRVTVSPSNRQAGNYFQTQQESIDWNVELQEFSYRDTPSRNLIARANVGQGPVIILGAHYDSRRRADRDPDHPAEPVQGANDGASGAAVLLELARSLDLRRVP